MERKERGSLAFVTAGQKLLVAAAISVALSGVPRAPALAGDGGWRVSDIQGAARLRQGTQPWRPLKRGQKIPPESQIETGRSGRLLLVRTGDSIAVAPNSRFAMPKEADRPSTRAHPMTYIAEKAGTLLFKIATRPDRPFGVKTPFLAAVIEGTTVAVSVESDSAALHVSRGAVKVSSLLSGQSVLVQPGQTAAVGLANGGRLRMIGGFQPKAGHSKAANNVTKGPLNATSPGLAAKGAKAVNSAPASKGLLFEMAPAVAPQSAGPPALDSKPHGIAGGDERVASAMVPSLGIDAGTLPEAGEGAPKINQGALSAPCGEAHIQ